MESMDKCCTGYFGGRNDGFDEGCEIDALPLAMAYVPVQKWEKLYEPACALEKGTLFCRLDLPFIGKGAVPDGK